MSQNPLDKLHDILLQKKLTISTAESCTGGLLASNLTDRPGSSKYFRGGIIAYHNDIKHGFLHVPKILLDRHGAVSYYIVGSMLEGCYKVFESDIVCATSGVMGPDGGTEETPVGTTFIGVSYGGNENFKVEKFVFSGDRIQNKKSAVEQAILLLLEIIDAHRP